MNISANYFYLFLVQPSDWSIIFNRFGFSRLCVRKSWKETRWAQSLGESVEITVAATLRGQRVLVAGIVTDCCTDCN